MCSYWPSSAGQVGVCAGGPKVVFPRAVVSTRSANRAADNINRQARLGRATSPVSRSFDLILTVISLFRMQTHRLE